MSLAYVIVDVLTSSPPGKHGRVTSSQPGKDQVDATVPG
jgi:hypothetical protein